MWMEQGNLSYVATVAGETRQFLRKTKLDHPNPWDCVPTPLLGIDPGNVLISIVENRDIDW